MKILRLDVEGFRSLKDISWEPDDLNVVIGPNASGKSNLLRALELVSISARGGLARYVQRSGGMEPLVWDGSAEEISFAAKMSPLDSGRDPVTDSLTYQATMSRFGPSSFKIGRELLGNFHRVETGERQEPFKFLERSYSRGVIFDEREHGLAAPEESIPEDETLLSLARAPFSQNRRIPPVRSELESWVVYHDLHVNAEAPIRQPVVAKLERRVDPDGQNLVSVLHTLYTEDREFKNEVGMAMKAAFGDDFDELVFPPAADQRIQLRVRWKSLRREQSAADLSDGTLRFLFLLAVLGSPSPAPVIAIDEPETGLHPSMLPVVAEYAVEASSRAQIILTTHSPQLLDAFHDTRPSTTVTRWREGQTVLTKLEGEALDYWLREYSLGSLYRSGELEEIE